MKMMQYLAKLVILLIYPSGQQYITVLCKILLSEIKHLFSLIFVYKQQKQCDIISNALDHFKRLLWEHQGFSQYLQCGCIQLQIAKFWGVPFFKRDPNIVRIQHEKCIF